MEPIAETPLQRHLIRAFVETAARDGWARGTPINQQALAARFGVSRSPLRAALTRLARLGVVEAGADGMRVADLGRAPALDTVAETDPVERLMAEIARDRHCGTLPESVSENDLMRRYAAPRRPVVTALRRMATLGLVARKPGFGWQFAAGADSPEQRRESYRFRLIVEPAALREPGYRPDVGWLKASRDQHHAYMERATQAVEAVAFFEMNAEFHRRLVTFSGNRFLVRAIEHMNALRRLRNYSWMLADARVAQSCAEHIDVLDRLIGGDTEAAAAALYRHIAGTMDAVA